MSSEPARSPRIEPLEGQAEGMLAINLFRTLAHHPKLHDRVSQFGGFLLFRGMLPERERELVILRTGWRCGSEYEYGQHTIIGATAGLTPNEIRRLALAATKDWDDRDRDLIVLVDELCGTNTVSETTWARLSERWSDAELLELLVVVGFYRMAAGLLNSVGVQLDDGIPGWPSAAKR